jgi:hypothetical protein
MTLTTIARTEDDSPPHDKAADMPEMCCTLPVTEWRPFCDMALQAQAVAALERGGVLYLPDLPFVLTPQEKSYRGRMQSSSASRALNIRLPARPCGVWRRKLIRRR